MYIPIMKNRTVEVSVLRRLSEYHVFDNGHVIPMIELIQERTKNNMKSTFLDELAALLDSSKSMQVMIDFFKSTKLRNTTEPIREYITQTNRQPQFCYDQINRLKSYADQVIPVISYFPEDWSEERFLSDCNYFKKHYPKVAFRIKYKDFEKVFAIVCNQARHDDIVIFDIEYASYTSPVFKKIYKQIADEKTRYGFTSAVVRAHRPEDLQNNQMADGEPIDRIDNGLRDTYKEKAMHQFDAFGDYASISASLPTKGGAISPVGIYYSAENNYFVSFGRKIPALSEFPNYIAPSIINSDEWKEYDDEHHRQCPGCIEIQDVQSGEKSGKNQAQWKMITMLHYIYTMFKIDA